MLGLEIKRIDLDRSLDLIVDLSSGKELVGGSINKASDVRDPTTVSL